ncbi:MAG: hypothetical protein ABH833_03110 [Parcubacteria group bacterium]
MCNYTISTGEEDANVNEDKKNEEGVVIVLFGDLSLEGVEKLPQKWLAENYSADTREDRDDFWGHLNRAP